MAYTSSSEFDHVKRIQITNEVPPVSLFYLLPQGLQNEFWKYVIGTADTQHNIPVIDNENRPKKIVNGDESPIYGPVVPETPPTFEDAEEYHNITIEGTIEPELDFMLHEMYRYLDTMYPDHPDYLELLTSLEMNEMFRAAAAVIGYEPNYTFIEDWSRSINGQRMQTEEVKWKIRDLRSLAFRRKFFGAYLGYKMICSSLLRHGSIYITGKYRPLINGDEATIDYEDFRANRRFRLIDFFNTNDTVYQENTRVTFKGLITPNYRTHVYHYAYQDTSIVADGALGRVSVNTFLSNDTINLPTPNVTVTSKKVGSTASNQYHFLEMSGSQYPTLRTYSIRDLSDPQDESLERRKIELTPSPFADGIFDFPLHEALSVYPDQTIIRDNIDLIGFSGSLDVNTAALCDTYNEGVRTYTDCANILHLTRGEITLNINADRSPILNALPDPDYPLYGIEFQVRRFEQNLDGTMQPITSSIFIQCTLTFTRDRRNRPTSATARIVTIPHIHPLTGESNDREYLLDPDQIARVTSGTQAYFLSYSEQNAEWSYMIGYEGWTQSVSWACIHTEELMYQDVPVNAAFTVESFERWKLRAAHDFSSEAVVLDELQIYGRIESQLPGTILVPNEEESKKLPLLTPGDEIRGPGLPLNTMVTYVATDYFEVSQDALLFGLSEFSIVLRQSQVVEDTLLDDFKRQVYNLHPDTDHSIYTAMWPSPKWPRVSSAYLEGLKDASLFQPLAVEKVTNDPAAIEFDKTVFLELSLDRVLRHVNSVKFKMGPRYVSLMDKAWLDYVENFLSHAARATEIVQLGTQLTLTTDESGLYTIIPENQYSDPDINARFTILPNPYENDETPTHLQLGTGGHTAERERLFTSISDLNRPPLYGVTTFDSNRDLSSDLERIEPVRRGTYASAKNIGDGYDDNIASIANLDSPLFEVPLGEHEYAVDVASEERPGNRYKIVTTSVYEEEFNDIEKEDTLIVNSPYIATGEQLPRELYRFRGRWNPAPQAENRFIPIWPKEDPNNPFVNRDYFLVSATNTVGTYEYEEGDWLVYNDGEWTRRQWLLLGTWPPDGEPEPDNGIYLSPSKTQLQTDIAPLGLTISEALDKYFMYYIASKDLELRDKTPEGEPTKTIDVAIDDWIILTKETYVDESANRFIVRDETGDEYYLISLPPGQQQGNWTPVEDSNNPSQPDYPDTTGLSHNDYFYITEDKTIGGDTFREGDYIQVVIDSQNNITWRIAEAFFLTWTEYQPWLVAGGRTYEIIRQSFQRTNLLDNTTFQKFVDQRELLIDNTQQILDLPREFLARGSCNFELKIDPEFYATDANGVRFSLTASPIYRDQTANRFYVHNQTADGSTTRHDIEFKDPTYFKNLYSLVGTVFADTPTEIHTYPDYEFNAQALSLTDSVKSGNYIFIRNEYEEALENRYYSHYITIEGEVNPDNLYQIRPITDSPRADDRVEDFRLSVLGIQPVEADDGSIAARSTVKTASPAIIRSYEDRFENRFFRNLLMVAGTVKRDTPNMILPWGDDQESLRAFAEALAELNPGDYIQGVYLTNGTTYRLSQNVLTQNDQQINVIRWGPGSWLAAGTEGTLLMNYSDTVDEPWETKSLPTGSNPSIDDTWDPIDAVNDAVYSQNIQSWWIVGESGNIARSYDDGENWHMVAGPEEWNGIDPSITCIEYSNPLNDTNVANRLLIGTDDGRIAYFDEDADENDLTAAQEWTPLPLPIEGQLDTEGFDPNADGTGQNEDDEEGSFDDAPPVTEGWGNNAVQAIGYNDITDTWMIGGSNGKLAVTDTLLDPVQDSDPDTDDDDLPKSQWTMLGLPDGLTLYNITAIRCVDGMWVVAGEYQQLGAIIYSDDDGVSWSIAQLKDQNDDDDDFGPIFEIEWKPGEWIATSEDGVVYTSAYNETNAGRPFSEALPEWTYKDIPSIPDMKILGVGVAADTVLLGGDDANIYIISNNSRPADALQIQEVNEDESIFNIVTEAPVVVPDDWEESLELRCLLQIYTLRSIEDSYAGVPADAISTLTNPRTRELYLPSTSEVEDADIANRVYMPRMNPFLLEPTIGNGDENPDYIGGNGYPTFEESEDAYVTGGAGNPELWTNDSGLTLHHCDIAGNYIDARGVALGTNSFTEQVVVEDEDTDQDTRTDRVDPREVAWQPLYTTYLEWLEDGNDIEISDDVIDLTGLGPIEVANTYNEQNETPWIETTLSVTLDPPYNGISLNILPASPVAIPLRGIPRYRTDMSGTNMGIVAQIQNNEVLYSIEPLENNTALIETRGDNEGVEFESGLPDGLYSIEPVAALPDSFVTDEGLVIEETRDGKTYYTVDDPELTGVYYHPNGYGSWADRPATNGLWPWENDPNAFVGEDTDNDGLNDQFYYLQNKRHDVIYVVDRMGERVVDENGDFIPSPAPKHLSYADLLAVEGDFAEKENITFSPDQEISITGVRQNGRAFEVSNPIPMEEGAFVRQVRLNLLTLASIPTTERSKTDERLVYKLTPQDLLRYEPDRVYYGDSAYPSQIEDPTLYQGGLFTNRNGAPVFRANSEGSYLDVNDEATLDLSARTRTAQPLYYLCQDWFQEEYFVEGDEDNPYWQYIIFEDYLDNRSKEWRQRYTTYRRVKGDAGQEMVLQKVPDEDAYVTLYPGLEYSSDRESLIVRQTDYIQYRRGRIAAVMVSNRRYSREEYPNVDQENAQYGLYYDSVFHEATDLEGNDIDMFDLDEVVQTELKGNWKLNYSVNTTKNFANPLDSQSSIVAITELGLFNAAHEMIAYANFPPVIYDSAKHHMSVNLLIKQGEFTPVND